MTITIHTGHHRPPWWIFLLWPWFGYKRKSVSRKVRFDFNCSYDLPGTDDDLDVNKVFGIGFLWSTKDSARFGWNYNNTTGKIDLFAYYHINGVRDFKKICSAFIGIEYLLILNIHDPSYSFSVVNLNTGRSEGNETIRKEHKKKWSYNMGCFFGGNQKAPHDITIEIKKV